MNISVGRSFIKLHQKSIFLSFFFFSPLQAIKLRMTERVARSWTGPEALFQIQLPNEQKQQSAPRHNFQQGPLSCLVRTPLSTHYLVHQPLSCIFLLGVSMIPSTVPPLRSQKELPQNNLSQVHTVHCNQLSEKCCVFRKEISY